MKWRVRDGYGPTAVEYVEHYHLRCAQSTPHKLYHRKARQVSKARGPPPLATATGNPRYDRLLAPRSTA